MEILNLRVKDIVVSQAGPAEVDIGEHAGEAPKVDISVCDGEVPKVDISERDREVP